MKENIKEKNIVPKIDLTKITSKNDNHYIKFEPNKKIDIFQINNNNKNKTKNKFLTRKKEIFVTKRIPNKNKKKFKNTNFNEGRWKKEENNQFILGIVLYGNNWKKVKSLIKTRTAVQVRSHAQKFINKMKLCKDDNLGIDFTLNSKNNINDMITHIKNINPNYDIINIFKILYYKSNNKNKFRKSNKTNKINNYENKIYNILINEEQKKIVNSEKVDVNNILENNQIIDNQNIYNNNLNIEFPQINNDLFNFNNYNNNINNNLPLNDNNNINNNFIIDYLSTNFNNLSFINYLYQINNLLLFEQMEKISAFIMENNIYLINILNKLNIPNNDNNGNLSNNNLYFKIVKASENNNNFEKNKKNENK